MKLYKKILIPAIPLTSIAFVVSCDSSNADADKNKWEKVLRVCYEDNNPNILYEVPIKVEYTYRGSEIRTVAIKEVYAKSVWEENGRKPNTRWMDSTVAAKVGIYDFQNISIINIEPSTI